MTEITVSLTILLLMRTVRRIARLTLLALSAVALTWAHGPPLLGSEDAPPARVPRWIHAMGTDLQLVVEARDRSTALKAGEAAVRAVEATEERLSTWRDESELSLLNRQPAGEPFLLSPELASELELARQCWIDTAGAFDPGLGSLVDAWDLRGEGRIVPARRVDLARSSAGMRHLELRAGRGLRRHAGLRIEEGAFGKGAALDHAIEALAAEGATWAWLDFGGEVAVFGGPAPFRIGVADPTRREREVMRLAVDGGAVATSGNSERARTVEGDPIGHLLDPGTGRPARDFGSVTVWAPSALVADCLSTGLYVMGCDEALSWASRRQGVEVLVLEPDPAGGLRAIATAGLRGRLEPRAEQVRLSYFKPPRGTSAASADRDEALAAADPRPRPAGP